MDKYEKRRLKLVELRDKRCEGVSANIARKIERDASYVNRLFYEEGKKGKKRIGDDIIELLENAFGLPRGWFDTDSDEEIFVTRNKHKQKVMEFIIGMSDDVFDEKFEKLLIHTAETKPENVQKNDVLITVVNHPEQEYSVTSKVKKSKKQGV